MPDDSHPDFWSVSADVHYEQAVRTYSFDDPQELRRAIEALCNLFRRRGVQLGLDLGDAPPPESVRQEFLARLGKLVRYQRKLNGVDRTRISREGVESLQMVFADQMLAMTTSDQLDRVGYLTALLDLLPIEAGDTARYLDAVRRTVRAAAAQNPRLNKYPLEQREQIDQTQVDHAMRFVRFAQSFWRYLDKPFRPIDLCFEVARLTRLVMDWRFTRSIHQDSSVNARLVQLAYMTYRDNVGEAEVEAPLPPAEETLSNREAARYLEQLTRFLALKGLPLGDADGMVIGAVEATTSPDKPKRPTREGDTEQQVAAYIAEQLKRGRSPATLTRDGIAAATALSSGAVSGTVAWKRLRTHKQHIETPSSSSKVPDGKNNPDRVIAEQDWEELLKIQQKEARSKR